jgi:2-polyprenyl-6-methoxyphenol hydroxylase-like FAD-dependent oxidoreductase
MSTSAERGLSSDRPSMPDSRESRVALVVGAGIGGLAAGVSLQQAGWRVRIFERATNPRELGFALLLAPNAVVSLERLGLAERVIAEGSEMTAGEIHGAAGRLLRRFDMARIRHLLPQPALLVLRPALHGVLLDAFGPQNLSLDSEVCGFSVRGRKPFVMLANGQRVEGDVLVGADGVGSVIRRVFNPDEPPPRHSGLWAIRGVAPRRGAAHCGVGWGAVLRAWHGGGFGAGRSERGVLVHLASGEPARRLT